ncbi:MAG: DUF4111 domain-containing protein, partial [Armatimonadetes bacterium]|nr:DUF4111 domain-containing protein [Anaerolineae bacterium]
MPVSWENCPTDTRVQVEGVITGCQAALGDDLTAVYLYGSLAMGCFNPALSDVNLMLVTAQPLSAPQSDALAQAVHALDGQPHALDVTVIEQAQLDPWQHPPTAAWRSQAAWHTDTDLTARLVMARERGIALLGEPLYTLLPDVPSEDFIDGLLNIFDSVQGKLQQQPVNSVLTMCRVCWYLA